MEYFLFIMISFWTILPMTIFLHELGHFFCACICRAKTIKMKLGVGKKLCSIKKEDFSLTIHILPLAGKTSYELSNKSKSKWTIAFISIGGPLLNGLVGALLLMPGLGTGDHFITIWFQWLALFNVWMFFANIIPFKVGRYYSDGWVIVKSRKF